MGLLGLTVLAYLALLVANRVRPARVMPKIPYWELIGLGSLFAMMAAGAVIPVLLRPLFIGHELLPGYRLGDFWGGVIGFIFYDLLIYGLHRAYHRVPVLWRWVHQLHHAPERMDTAGTVLFHPTEMVMIAVTSTVAYGWIFGLTAEGAQLGGSIFLALGVFQHANIRTPAWLGYFIQRPEAHGVHHQRGLHAYNYSDFPLWDLLFGTFRNPAVWEEEAGLKAGAMVQWREMLIGVDISKPSGQQSPRSS